MLREPLSNAATTAASVILVCLAALALRGCSSSQSAEPDAAAPEDAAPADQDAAAPDAGPPPSCPASATEGLGLPFPGPDPGPAVVNVADGTLSLENARIAMSWTLADGAIRPARLEDRLDAAAIDLRGELFEVQLGPHGRQLRASELQLVGEPRAEPTAVDCESPRLARRFSGQQITAELKNADGTLSFRWTAELRDSSSYLRQQVTVRAGDKPVDVQRLTLVQLLPPSVKLHGSVDGSVVFSDRFYFGMEHPMAQNIAGVPFQQVGTWGPADVSYPERKVLEWDATAAIRDKGRHLALFDYTSGGYRLEIFWAALLENGKEVARDEHFGATGTVDVVNTYHLELPSHDPTATYTLRAETRADGGTDSTGTVSIAPDEPGLRVHCSLPQQVQLAPGAELAGSAVIGVTPPGQLRRGFLYYIERERAHPYRPFLHYNSWYDIGYFSQYGEADCRAVIDAYGEQLNKQRGVTLDSFLFDDGWDDPETLWSFHSGFPQGFTPVREAAARYGAAPGIWLSPWGGYGPPKEQRLAYGKAAGYETNEKGFVLSAPKYFARFREICLELVEKYGVNQFKFDGIGQSSEKYPGSAFNSDFEAAIQLITDLRAARSDIFINLTTGTWPSPFWLLHADSIWRGGYDHEFLGVGTDRQRWISYRDARTYQRVVQRGPLFPLSSLMLHGVIYAKHARQLDTDPGDDLRDEIRTAFGCGTQLQELYVTPSLLTKQNWDDLAAAARWARANAATLQDVHWVGGDPEKLVVYGWAAWSPDKAIITLRNPADKAGTITLDAATVFELPDGAPGSFALTSPYADQRLKALTLSAGTSQTVQLQPFEVLVFEGTGT